MDRGQEPGRFPLPATALPAFEPLLDGGLWNEWATEGRVFALDSFRRAVTYVRLKPGTSCRLVVFGGPPAAPGLAPPGFILQLFADLGRARQAYRKETARPERRTAEGLVPFLSESHAVVAVPFPNDRAIPGLRHLYDPHRRRNALRELLPQYPPERWKLRRAVDVLELLSYKPERRAVFRVCARIDRLEDGHSERVGLHVKVEHPTTSEQSHRNLAAIHAAVPAGSGWGVPSPLGIVAERHLSAAEWVDAPPLAAALAGASVDLERFRGAGRALAGLHGLHVDLPPAQTAAEQASELLALARDLAELLPGEGTRILALGERLAPEMLRTASGPTTVVHGDFHVGQVLCGEDTTVLVDLDRAGIGCPAVDLGSFLAHLAELAVDPRPARAFLDGYRETARAPLDVRTIERMAACGAFRRAVFPFRRLRDDWPERTRRILDNAETPQSLVPA